MFNNVTEKTLDSLENVSFGDEDFEKEKFKKVFCEFQKFEENSQLPEYESMNELSKKIIWRLIKIIFLFYSRNERFLSKECKAELDSMKQYFNSTSHGAYLRNKVGALSGFYDLFTEEEGNKDAVQNFRDKPLKEEKWKEFCKNVKNLIIS
ncbi:MAG: hypothetical protein ABIF17_04985 [Patescibacteria group bacterium]